MLSKFSVKRPYTVLVGVVLVIVLGVVALRSMTADLLPNMTFPYAVVITTDMGASPEAVETDVTAPIEAALATTSNLKKIQSRSLSLRTRQHSRSLWNSSTHLSASRRLNRT